MNDCIFCKIVTREIPATIVAEDEHTLAFLDIHPNIPGHTLVIPKKHIVDYLDADAETLSVIATTVQRVARGVLKGVSAEGFNLLVNTKPAAGQVIFHMHWHIVPRSEGDGLRHWPGSDYAPGEMEDTAAKIRNALETV